MSPHAAAGASGLDGRDPQRTAKKLALSGAVELAWIRQKMKHGEQGVRIEKFVDGRFQFDATFPERTIGKSRRMNVAQKLGVG